MTATRQRTSRSDRTPRGGKVETRGLTHIALAVRDLDRTAAFYQRLLGAVEVYRDGGFLQMQTPGSWDVLVFEQRPSEAGRGGGVLHFGFRLLREDGLTGAEGAVHAAGGTIVEKGEFVPGEPYLFVKDPDGYIVELWYELPTKADPKPPRSASAARPTNERARRAGASRSTSRRGRP